MRIEAGREADLAPGQARKLDVSPPIALIRGESGAFYAVDDTCTHATASLSMGFVDGEQIECPLHMGMFCLKTGQPTAPPVTDPIKVHLVSVIDGVVYVDVER